MSEPVTLRPATPDDREFLHAVYAGTRQQEMALVDWSEAQKQTFVRMQFEAQDRHYTQHYPNASFDVIVAGGVPVGRLCVDRKPDAIHIVDIALLPAHRGAGIGTTLLEAILAEGVATAKPVSIHVEQFNPALRLYERLGFARVGEQGIHHLMEWRPQAQANTAS